MARRAIQELFREVNLLKQEVRLLHRPRLNLCELISMVKLKGHWEPNPDAPPFIPMLRQDVVVPSPKVEELAPATDGRSFELLPSVATWLHPRPLCRESVAEQRDPRPKGFVLDDLVAAVERKDFRSVYEALRSNSSLFESYKISNLK